VRNISSELLAHLQQPTTTTCKLLLFTFRDGRTFGLTSLDRDLTYDGVTYSFERGFDPKVIASDTGLSVDNSEAYALLSADNLGITKEMVAAGEMDDAQWQMMLVNYRDLTMGHLLIDAGDVGQVVMGENDFVYMPELISYAMRLRQAIGTFDSRRCRAIFGSPPDSQTGCGVDAESMWQAGTVTGVSSTEARRVFADSTLLLTPDPIPGRVRWITGPNASLNRLYQVEAYSNVSGTIALIEPLPFDITAGDDFEIRYDCAKTHSACVAYGNLINMKGEWFIPTGDGLESMSPNSQIAGGMLGSEIIDT